MAEGGSDPMDPTTEKDPLTPGTGDDDDWDNLDFSKIPVDTEDPDRTQPFEPGAASTPYHGGEEHEMSTLPTEDSGLVHGPGALAWNSLTFLYPEANATELEAFYDPVTKRLKIKMAGSGKTSYYLMTEDKASKTEKLNPKLTKEIRKALGESALDLVSVLQEERDRNRREIVEKTNRKKQLEEQTAQEVQEIRQEIAAQRNQMRQLDEDIRELEDKAGPWDEEEIQKRKDEKRALDAEIQRKKAKLDQANANAKTGLQLKVDINDLKLANRDIDRKINKLGIKVAKPLEELQQEKAALEERLAKNKRVLEDENASASEREAAQKKVAQNERALERVNEDVEREEQKLPLRERVKNIFKKYGWTLQAVALAVGIVLSALALAATNGLKAGTKAIGNGLEAIGKKLGSLLPGLIGSIVSYIFKAAGQVFSFLGSTPGCSSLPWWPSSWKGCSRGGEDKHILYPMAEGGFDPTTENETPWEDHGIDHDGDDDEEYTTPRSSPMKPPPPPPEEIEMSQLPREQNGWRRQKAAWVDLKKMYPQANKDALEVSYVKMPGKEPRLSVKMVGSTRAYWLFEPNLFGRWRENPDLPQEIKTYLGKSIEEQIEGFQKLKAKKEAKLAAKQKQEKQLEEKVDEKQKLSRDMDSLTNEIRDLEEHMRELEDVHGSIDTEAIQKIKDEKRVKEGEKKNIQQRISQLQKDIIQYNTKQEEDNQLRHDIGELNQHLNELRAKKETLKPLNELEQEAEELNRKITEDKQLIADENTSPSERTAAEARLSENEAELDRINTEIEVRERERPLLERVKDIFKKYGWTLQAIFVAVGVILSVIALTVKKGTKVISQKLNNVKQEPGFIGSIVSFIFKAAGQVFAFLSEHTWLIILVVVAFFMEKMLKKRRR